MLWYHDVIKHGLLLAEAALQLVLVCYDKFDYKQLSHTAIDIAPGYSAFGESTIPTQGAIFTRNVVV